MTPQVIGMLIGAAVGVASWFMLTALAGRVELPETVKLLRIVAGLDLIILPAIGYGIGLLVFGESSMGAFQ